MPRQHVGQRFAEPALLVAVLVCFAGGVLAADAQEEWCKTIEAAKKEGEIVAGGPPTAVLRKQYIKIRSRAGLVSLELVSAPGPQNAGKAIAEFRNRCWYTESAMSPWKKAAKCG
jgi:hypothetical protein